MKDWLNQYVQKQHAALDTIPLDQVANAIDIIKRAVLEDRQIFACGNGGSASNISHFITDLGKCSSDAIGRRFRCLSLNENLSWITAIGNDYAYEDIYLRQLENYGRAGDILLTLSVSGSSPNIVKAVKMGNDHDMQTIALVGSKRGKVAEIAKHLIVVGDTHYGRVEDVQMNICHMLCYAFVEKPEIARATQ